MTKADYMTDPVMMVRVTMTLAAKAMATEIEKIAPEIMQRKGYTKPMMEADSSKMDEVMKEVHEAFLKTETHAKNEILWESLLRRLASMMNDHDSVGFYAAAGQLLMKNPMSISEIDGLMSAFGKKPQTDDKSSSPSDPGRS